jgi:hypothetical protein
MCMISLIEISKYMIIEHNTLSDIIPAFLEWDGSGLFDCWQGYDIGSVVDGELSRLSML